MLRYDAYPMDDMRLDDMRLDIDAENSAPANQVRLRCRAARKKQTRTTSCSLAGTFERQLLLHLFVGCLQDRSFPRGGFNSIRSDSAVCILLQRLRRSRHDNTARERPTATTNERYACSSHANSCRHWIRRRRTRQTYRRGD